MSVISENIIKLLNYRIQQEEYSSRIYLAMSMWLDNEGFVGAAKRWKQYSDEELVHANFARDYLLSLDIQPFTPSLDLPKQEFSGLVDIIQQSYKHEIDITEQCSKLAKACFDESDFMTLTLAQKYLSEQVEEIKKVTDLMNQLKSFGTDKVALRLLDNQLG